MCIFVFSEAVGDNVHQTKGKDSMVHVANIAIGMERHTTIRSMRSPKKKKTMYINICRGYYKYGTVSSGTMGLCYGKGPKLSRAELSLELKPCHGKAPEELRCPLDMCYSHLPKLAFSRPGFKD